MDCSLPISSVHEILQARILEWAAISFSGDLSNPGIEPRPPALQADSLLFEPLGKHKELFFHIQHIATPWTVAHQAPLVLGISQTRILE